MAKSRDIQRNREQLRRFCQPFPVVGLSDEDVQVFGEVRVDLERRGLPIGAYDLLIAAQAKCCGLVLVRGWCVLVIVRVCCVLDIVRVC